MAVSTLDAIFKLSCSKGNVATNSTGVVGGATHSTTISASHKDKGEGYANHSLPPVTAVGTTAAVAVAPPSITWECKSEVETKEHEDVYLE